MFKKMKSRYIVILLLFTLMLSVIPSSIISAASDIIITTDSEYNIGYADQATYKSSDTKIISVSKYGVVKGIKAGRASITVKTKGNNTLKQTMYFSVKESSINYNGQKSSDSKVYYEDKNQTNTTMKKSSPIISGENVIVNYTTTLTANKPVNWSVSDSTKAKINNTSTYTTSCEITGLQQGTLFIIAIDKDGYTTKLPYVVTAKVFFTIIPSLNYSIDVYKDWFTDSQRTCYLYLHKIGTYSFETSLKSNIKCISSWKPRYKSGLKFKLNNANTFTLSGKVNGNDKYLLSEVSELTISIFTATSLQTNEKITIVVCYK